MRFIVRTVHSIIVNIAVTATVTIMMLMITIVVLIDVFVIGALTFVGLRLKLLNDLKNFFMSSFALLLIIKPETKDLARLLFLWLLLFLVLLSLASLFCLWVAFIKDKLVLNFNIHVKVERII